MSLIKFNIQNRFFPWTSERLNNFLNVDFFFKSDLLEEDSLMPAMNVKEHKKDFEIEFAAPGFLKKDFEVTINDNTLTVSAHKKHKEEEVEEDYTRKEFSYNSFKRSFTLPKTVNKKEDVKATYKNGILKLNIHKIEQEEEQPKKIIEVV